jgi:arylsulfatase A-like enzyme
VLRAWWAFLTIDLAQVAVRAPGALGPDGVVWLAGLWLVVVVLAAGALRAVRWLVRWRWPARRARPSRGALAAMAVVLAAAAVGATGGGRGAAPPPADRPAATGRPNLVLVVIDTLRADHLACYGYHRPTSPVLDALAARGLLFEHAYAQSSWTKPATASLLTGRSPTEHQTLSETARLPDAEVTVAERLRAHGYRTAMLSANPWITPEYGFDQGADEFVSIYDERFVRVTLLMQGLRRVSALTGGRLPLYNRIKYLVLGELSTTARDTRLVDLALAWLERRPLEPFFLYLHMMSPHHPYDPPPPFDRFVPDRSHAPVRNHPRKSYRFFEQGDPLPDAALADMVARYDGDVLYADTELGRLLAGVDRLRLRESTAIVVTADHGEEFFEHRNWGHGQSLYNELVRIPLVVSAPGHAAPHRVTPPVSHADVVPTLLALAGAPPGAGLRGRNLLAPSATDPPAVSELLYRYGTSRSVVRRDDKLVLTEQGERHAAELFDLGTDPTERRPLPTTDPRAASLTAVLDEHVALATRARSRPTDVAVDDDTRTNLRALGYAQ